MVICFSMFGREVISYCFSDVVGGHKMFFRYSLGFFQCGQRAINSGNILAWMLGSAKISTFFLDLV